MCLNPDFCVFPGNFPGKSENNRFFREISREIQKIIGFPENFPGKRGNQNNINEHKLDQRLNTINSNSNLIYSEQEPITKLY